MQKRLYLLQPILLSSLDMQTKEIFFDLLHVLIDNK